LKILFGDYGQYISKILFLDSVANPCSLFRVSIGTARLSHEIQTIKRLEKMENWSKKLSTKHWIFLTKLSVKLLSNSSHRGIPNFIRPRLEVNE